MRRLWTRLGRWHGEPRIRRLARVALGLGLAPVALLLVAAAFQPLPAELRPGAEPTAPSVRVLDRNGRVIRVVRRGDAEIGARVRLDRLGPELPNAVLAAEDARFWQHPGVDPLAIGRAAAQAVLERRVVSGASTLTQQLARTLVPRPRTLRGKLKEMALALRIEASVDKRRVLEEYLNRVEFGPGLRGVEAASRHYFDKPAEKLGLAEAATLAAIPRGPSLYDPRRGVERVQRRRDRVLERMRARGLASDAAVELALAQPVELQPRRVEGGAQHFVRAVVSGALVPELIGQGPEEITTTLDADLQRQAETLVAAAAERIAAFDASAAAVIVVDVPTAEVLAYVGSPDPFDAARLGQNDGVRARRQPGSTLKPFVYAAAIEHRGWTAATVLPDVELTLAGEEGAYTPRNYDGRFHGPVRLRDALASSLNVPAVWTAHEVGPDRVLEKLRQVGFASLDRDAAHYGAALALGDGEVTLLELVAAYATLARRGQARPLSAVRSARLSGGSAVVLPPQEATRVLDTATAELLIDVLADPHARASAFGRGSVLELPFPVAAKTGTSKGHRDNWVVGATREVAVAVWVGNFDGHPMVGSSGITGAGPLFREVMLAAMQGRESTPLVGGTDLEAAEICSLSGERPGAHCALRVLERFVPGSTPRGQCGMHVEAEVDPANGLRAGSGCRHAETRVFESYPARYAVWAARAGRPALPAGYSPRCPGDATGRSLEAPSVAFPFDGARFAYDPALSPTQQAIRLAARVPADVVRVSFVVDGRPLGSVAAPFSAIYPLRRGEHQLRVETADGRRSEPVRFLVD